MVSAQQIAKAIGEARRAWALTQKQLAQRAGVEEREVRTAEKSGQVDASTLGLLAKALGGSLSDLLDGRPFWQAPAVAFKSTPGEVDPVQVWSGLVRVAGAAHEHDSLCRFMGLPSLWEEHK